MKKKLLSGVIALTLICSFSTTVFASDSVNSLAGFSPETATMAPAQSQSGLTKIPRAAQGKTYTIPGSKGTITSNAWRTSGDGTISGNTRQWDYQVSAVYAGNQTVAKIRTTWQGSASLRNGANFSLGISGTGVTVGGGSSWQGVTTTSKYWENSNGSKESSYRSNMIATPGIDYRSGTVSITNEAKVTLKGDPKPYSINASA